MTTIRIGLVTEGPTDQVVLKALLTAALGQRHGSVACEFRDLQPNPDRTSGGGLEMIYKWCRNTLPDERAALFQKRGLFAGFAPTPPLDAIIIQLDGDACDSPRMPDLSPIEPIPAGEATARERGGYIEKTLDHWLWSLDETWSGEKDLRQIPAPVVESIETWLVAGLSEDSEPEENKRILRRLVELDFSLRGKPVPEDAKKVAKKEPNYRRLSEPAAQRIDRILSCHYFNQLVSRILALSQPHGS